MSTGLYSGVSGLAIDVGLYKGTSSLWGGANGLINPPGGATLTLGFLNVSTLPSTITFSRTSNATLVDSTGKLTYAPNNLVTNSEAFDATTWTKSGSTITANAIAAPNGSTTADKLVEDLTTAPHYFSQNFSAVVGYAYTYSIYAKAGERTFVQLIVGAIGSPSVNAVSCFDLVNGTFTANTGGQTTTITPIGNGWYRCSVSLKSALTATANVQLRLSATSTTTAASYTGDGTSGAYVWGIQLELATYQTTPGTYVSTTPANLLGYTQEFDNAAWLKSNATVTANAAVAPDGTTSADKLVEAATTSEHYTEQNITILSGSSYTFSMYAKAGERNQIVLRLTVGASWVGGASPQVLCDLSTGAVSTIAGTVVSSSVTAVGGGWYRCSMTAVAAASGTVQGRVGLYASGSITYTGDGTSGAFIWGAQLSNSASVDPYVYNPAAALTSTAYYGPRFDYDPVTLVSKGLLIEEQRTNLVLQSETFDNASWVKNNGTVTADTTASPDGTADADAFIENTTASAFHYINQSTTKAASAIQYAASFYLKNKGRQVVVNLQSGGSNGVAGRVDPATGTVTSAIGAFGTGWTAGTLTMTDVGNGWYRVVVTATSDTLTSLQFQLSLHNGTTNVYTGDGVSGMYLYGAQIEAGAFATSYIPTVAAQVTRSADIATMTGTNFSSWYSQSAGTMLCNFALEGIDTSGGAAVVWKIDDTTNNNVIFVRQGTVIAGFDANIVTGGVNVYDSASFAAIAGSIYNSALTWEANYANLASNGAVLTASTSLALPTTTRLVIHGATGSMWMRSLVYYPTRLPDATLQALTS